MLYCTTNVETTPEHKGMILTADQYIRGSYDQFMIICKMAENNVRISVCSMLQEIGRKLITRNLRSDEMDYIYFTIDRVEHI